jgi:two-component system, NarL family, response regulator DesR
VIRVLVADGKPIFRSGLVALLDDERDITVVETVGGGRQVVAAACRCTPDAALIDRGLSGVDGITAAMLLRQELPQCAVIVMADRIRPGDLRRAVAAGAAGFMLKDASSDDLKDAVRRVARGERVIAADLAIAELGLLQSPLTPRETDVLRAAAEGATVVEIAQELCLSRGTVRNFLSRTLTKIGARTRVEAVTIARKQGWLWQEGDDSGPYGVPARLR